MICTACFSFQVAYFGLFALDFSTLLFRTFLLCLLWTFPHWFSGFSTLFACSSVALWTVLHGCLFALDFWLGCVDFLHCLPVSLLLACFGLFAWTFPIVVFALLDCCWTVLLAFLDISVLLGLFTLLLFC